MWGQWGPSGCFVTVSVLQVLWAPYTTLASACLPVSVVSGGAALGTHPLRGASHSVAREDSPCGVWALETCSCQGQNMCLAGSPKSELGVWIFC